MEEKSEKVVGDVGETGSEEVALGSFVDPAVSESASEMNDEHGLGDGGSVMVGTKPKRGDSQSDKVAKSKEKTTLQTETIEELF